MALFTGAFFVAQVSLIIVVADECQTAVQQISQLIKQLKDDR